MFFYNVYSFKSWVYLSVCLCYFWFPLSTSYSFYLQIFYLLAAAAAKSCQSCLTLCDPIDGSPLGSSVPGILQARTLEWVAISFFNAWKWKVKVKSLSRARLLETPWTAAYQAPPSMGFSRQEYWSGVPLPSPKVIIYYYFSKKKDYFLKQTSYIYITFVTFFSSFFFNTAFLKIQPLL